MLAVCVGGLWLILRLGGRLKAPADLSGAWELISYSPAPEGEPEDENRPRPILHIDQSGRFFEFRFPDGRVFDLRAANESLSAPGGQPDTVHLSGKTWRLVAQVKDEGRSMSAQLTGPEGASTFTARRVREAGEAGERPHANQPNSPNPRAPMSPAPASGPSPAPAAGA